MDTVLISLRIPRKLLAEIDFIAKKEHRSRANVIQLRLGGYDEPIKLPKPRSTKPKENPHA
jgi:hypothetical protein